MAADFFFEPATFDVPSLDILRMDWDNIPNISLRETIVAEHQYLLFHFFLLDSVKHTRPGCVHNPTYICQLDWGVRIGAIKAAILVAGSIIEAALLAHAVYRGYKLPKKNRNRTFGIVVEAWEKSGSSDINNNVLKKVKWLKRSRNNVHLSAVIHSDPNFNLKLYKYEAIYLNALKELMIFFQALKS